MSYIIKMLLLSIVMISIACQDDQPAAKTEFVALDQERGYWFGSPPFLIKKVHRAQLRIAYGFADNNRCGNRFSGRYGEQLLDSVSDTLRVWLRALNEQSNIVNNFNYELRRVRRAVHRLSLVYGWFETKPDLAIIFYCQRGRAFMQTKPFPVVHMLQATNNSNHNRMTTLRRYRTSTLLHELGHAFGLGDTYVDKTSFARRIKRYNRSTGGAHITTGMQPISVMNHHRQVALNANGALQLSADDHAGIQWLYERYISKKTKRRNCPFEYRRERTTKGCAPVYPLIHAVKQHNWTVVQELLRDDKSIDINTQDNRGNTALHYAALTTTNTKSSDLYYYLVYSGADNSIRNQKGDSAADLRQRNTTAQYTLATSIVTEIQRGETAYAAWLLSYAYHNHDANIVKRVLNDSKTRINSCGRGDMTVLEYAAYSGYAQVVQLLLQQPGVEVNKQCASGDTALHMAASMGQLEVTKLLLAHRRIDANLKNIAGDTPHSLVLASIARHRSNLKQRERLEAVESAINDYFDACVRARKVACIGG